MIFVTVGTMFLDFARLIRKMDAIAAASSEPVLIQRGLAATRPAHCESFDFLPHPELLALQREARVIVCHAGIGAVTDAMRCARPLVVVPRLKRHGEHMNDHQCDLAEAVQARGWGRMILNIDDLDDAVAAPPPVHANYAPAREPLLDALRDAVRRLAAGGP